VVVLGGGFGGLETAFSLRKMVGDAAAITLVSDLDHFYFKPNSIYVPFGLDPKKLRVPLERPAKRKGIELIQARARSIDPDVHRVESETGQLDYDYLVVATGAGMRAEEIPGLPEFAQGTWTAEDMLALRQSFAELLDAARGGERRRVLFLVPPNNKCAGPLYEIVLMFDTWLGRHGAGDNTEITWTTYEPTFIHAFGPRLHDVVSEEFERRGIAGHAGYVVKEVGPEAVNYENGESLDYDLLVSLPPYVAAESFPGLPSDDRGFIQTELATRQVVGHPDVYAVGDSGDFPVKQAFLAFLQGDAAAAHIGSRILDSEPSGLFDPVSMCVMEQFDKATFAKVPLRLTGNPADPIEVRPDAEDEYEVGSSKVWRMGKKMLGLSVPWRFGRGQPFHGGAFWAAMNTGLKAMAGLFAEASAAGRAVMAHAQATDGIKAAVRAGVRSIEHGIFLDDEAIELMRERGTWLVPTLSAPHGVIAAAAEGAMMPEASVRKAHEVIEAHTASYRRAVAGGVRVAMGTDTPCSPHGSNLGELRLMVAGGAMNPTQALVAATSSAAELLGVGDELGTLEPGKRADFVVVRGDALDFDGLEDRIEQVWQDGRKVVG